jgi:hypothetical protein
MMNRQNYHRYETWSKTDSLRSGRRGERRSWTSAGPDLDHRANQFMGTGFGRLSAALGLGLLVGLAYAVIFGLSFFAGLLFMFLCSALAVGLNLFLKQES